MIIKELLLNAWEFVKTKVVSIGKFIIGAIGGASIGSIAKFAVGAGCGVAALVMALKLFKDRIHSKKDAEKEKTPVEKILDINYADYRKKGTLHRRMKKVSSEAWTDLCRKPHKRVKYGWLKNFIKDVEKRNGKIYVDDDYDFDFSDTASRDWWHENCNFCWDTDRPKKSVRERYDEFCDYFFNNNVDGEKDDDYDEDLHNVWEFGRLHGWNSNYDY